MSTSFNVRSMAAQAGIQTTGGFAVLKLGHITAHAKGEHMTREDITRMAREAGGLPDPMVFIGAYERFAALVAAAAKAEEREECAKLCEKLRDEDGYEAWNTECASAIRARGSRD